MCLVFCFWSARLSAALILRSSSKSLARSPGRYSYTVPYPAIDLSAILRSLFHFSISSLMDLTNFDALLRPAFNQFDNGVHFVANTFIQTELHLITFVAKLIFWIRFHSFGKFFFFFWKLLLIIIELRVKISFEILNSFVRVSAGLLFVSPCSLPCTVHGNITIISIFLKKFHFVKYNKGFFEKI